MFNQPRYIEFQYTHQTYSGSSILLTGYKNTGQIEWEFATTRPDYISKDNGFSEDIRFPCWIGTLDDGDEAYTIILQPEQIAAMYAILLDADQKESERGK